MSDYIKREEAIFIALQQPFYSVVSQIRQLEGIDIVRCKECKWKRLYDEGDTKYYYCALEDRPNRQWSIDETDYCSWGERDE